MSAGPEGPRRVGLDIGGTKVHGVVVDDAGRVLAQARAATGRGGGDGVAASAVAVLDELRDRTGERPESIGVGIPGIVDGEGGVRHAVNLGIAERFPLADVLEARTGTPVLIENDLTAATWGARVLYDVDDLAYLSLGTGLAAGFVLDGVLRRGDHGAAGEIGHLVTDPGGPRCSCGQRGCLELTGSGAALAAAWPQADGRPAAEAVFAAAHDGDPRAVDVRDRFVAAVGEAVRVLGLTLDTTWIVLGGGVTALGTALGDALVAHLRHQAEESPFLASLDLAGRLRLVPPHEPVGAIGAAMLGVRR
ncbi:MAG TPA: ROK family protein [Nocardioides sp.]|nr:ROK family protein [Nocardioides sp.]